MKRPYKTKAYPVVPIIFLLFVLWNVFYLFKEKTTETLIGLGTLLFSLLIYFIINSISKKQPYEA